VQAWFFPFVPALSQKVNVRICPVCSMPTWQPVPATEQPALVVTSQFDEQRCSFGMLPIDVPSLIWRAQMPPVFAQSVSVSQNWMQRPCPVPRQMLPGSH
jgi:hypothetical protein